MATPLGTGTRADPWHLTTAPGTSTYEMWRHGSASPAVLVCQVGGTQLCYHLHCLPPLLEALGPAEVTHDAKTNRMRARLM